MEEHKKSNGVIYFNIFMNIVALIAIPIIIQNYSNNRENNLICGGVKADLIASIYKVELKAFSAVELIAKKTEKGLGEEVLNASLEMLKNIFKLKQITNSLNFEETIALIEVKNKKEKLSFKYFIDAYRKIDYSHVFEPNSTVASSTARNMRKMNEVVVGNLLNKHKCE